MISLDRLARLLAFFTTNHDICTIVQIANARQQEKTAAQEEECLKKQ
jgi:hypothetical protein